MKFIFFQKDFNKAYFNKGMFLVYSSGYMSFLKPFLNLS